VTSEMGFLDQLPWDLVTILAVMVILALPFLYDTHGPLQYHSRFIFYIASVSATATACIPIFMLRPWNVKNILYITYILKHVTKVMGITWELRGAEYLGADRGCVIVANHQSMLDILGMFNIWHVMDKCAAVAKKELFYVWPFGLAAWLGGLVYIDRLNSSKAHDQLNNAAKLMKTDKKM
ncbi:hypothetical protein L9F63_015575, partial [Diploptera punctata]